MPFSNNNYYYHVDVECGRVQPIWKGEIIYVNLTTHLGSIINYSCGTGYRLVGDQARVCQENGKWSGNKAKCEGNQIKYY